MSEFTMSEFTMSESTMSKSTMSTESTSARVIQAVYVDDMTLYRSEQVVSKLAKALKDRFQLSEAGQLHFLILDSGNGVMGES